MIIDDSRAVELVPWGPRMRVRTISSPRFEVEKIRVYGSPLVTMRPEKGLVTVDLERCGIGGEETHISWFFRTERRFDSEVGKRQSISSSSIQQFRRASWIDCVVEEELYPLMYVLLSE